MNGNEIQTLERLKQTLGGGIDALSVVAESLGEKHPSEPEARACEFIARALAAKALDLGELIEIVSDRGLKVVEGQS